MKNDDRASTQSAEISDFLAGRLSADAKREFEARLVADASLKEAVEDERLLNTALDRFVGLAPTPMHEKRALRALQAKLHPAKDGGRLFRLAWAAGIAAALVLGAFVVFIPATQPNRDDNQPIAQNNDSEVQQDGPRFTFDELEFLGDDEKNDEADAADPKGKLASLIAEVKATVSEIDKERLEVVLDASFVNLKYYEGHEDFWRQVAEAFDPLNEAAFGRAFEKYSERILSRGPRIKHDDAPRGNAERRRPEENGCDGPPRERGGRDKMREQWPLNLRIARLLHNIPPEHHVAWLEGLKARVDAISLEDAKEARRRIRLIKGSDERLVRLAFSLVGEWRASEALKDGGVPSLDSATLASVIASVNEFSAGRALFLLKMRDRRGENEPEGAPESASLARSELLELQRRRFSEVLSGDPELAAKLSALSEADLASLVRDVYEISRLVNWEPSDPMANRELILEHLRFRLSEGRTGGNMLEPRLRDAEKHQANDRKPNRGDPRGPRGERNRGEERGPRGDGPQEGPGPSGRRGKTGERQRD